MYLLSNSNFSSGSSLAIIDKEKLLNSPDSFSKNNFPRDGKTYFDRKRSSLLVVDEEISKIPIFNFEEKKNTSKNSNENSYHIDFWKKISQSILKPYLSKNKILLYKYLKNLESKRQIEGSMIKKAQLIESDGYKIEKKTNFTNLHNFNNKSFEIEKINESNNNFSIHFRRRSCYNTMEGEMTSKQKKFYNIYVEKKKAELIKITTYEEISDKKSAKIHKKLPIIKEKKEKTNYLGYFRIRPNEKLINSLKTKTEDNNRKYSYLESGNSHLILNSEKKTDSVSSLNTESEKASEIKSSTLNNGVQEVNLTTEHANINGSIPDLTSHKKIRIETKKSTYIKPPPNFMSSRKTMPSLTPTLMEFSILESKILGKKESIYFGEKNGEKIIQEFEKVIKNINEKEAPKKHPIDLKRTEKIGNVSIWTNNSELENLLDFKKKMKNSFENNKDSPKHSQKTNRKKGKKSENNTNTDIFKLNKEDYSSKIINFREKIKKMEKSIEADSRNLYYYSKIPKRKRIFSKDQSLQNLYGFSQMNNTSLSRTQFCTK